MEQIVAVTSNFIYEHAVLNTVQIFPSGQNDVDSTSIRRRSWRRNDVEPKLKT